MRNGRSRCYTSFSWNDNPVLCPKDFSLSKSEKKNNKLIIKLIKYNLNLTYFHNQKLCFNGKRRQSKWAVFFIFRCFSFLSIWSQALFIALTLLMFLTICPPLSSSQPHYNSMQTTTIVYQQLFLSLHSIELIDLTLSPDLWFSFILSLLFS